MSILELRQYTMVPCRRDDFARIFDREFVESQEVLGIDVVGQFLDADRPDRYVWLRAFPDMKGRRAALDAFYTGPVWAEHSGDANETMTEWHDVLLLAPAWEGSGFSDLPPRRARGETAGDRPGGDIFASIVDVEPSAMRDVVETVRRGAANLLGAYRTLHAPNTYPRLPIRDDASVLVLFARSPDRLPVLDRPGLQLRLKPTARSRLR